MKKGRGGKWKGLLERVPNLMAIWMQSKCISRPKKEEEDRQGQPLLLGLYTSHCRSLRENNNIFNTKYLSFNTALSQKFSDLAQLCH